MTQQEFQQRYTYNPLTDKLGEGGFGSVFKAYDTYRDRWVAVKVARVIPGMETVRLRKEVEMVAGLPLHPNIAYYEECHTFPQMDGEYDFGILQYYEEGNLSRLLQTAGLPPEQRTAILLQLLDGLNFLHQHGIIHRDLKPPNILIVKRGQEYIPKITDFGISKQLDINKSSVFSNSIAGAGTLAYASPEQLSSREIRKNTDLWSFGVIACEMFTGNRPFTTGGHASTSEAGRLELFRQINTGDLPDAVRTIPAPWQTLVRTCLQPDPAQRIKDVAAAKALLSGKENVVKVVTEEKTRIDPPKDKETIVEPKPQPKPQSDKKKPKTNRKAAVIAGVITGLLALFILIGVFSSDDDPIPTEPQSDAVLIEPQQDTAVSTRPQENKPTPQNEPVSTRPQENKPTPQNEPVSTRPQENKPTTQNTPVSTRPQENKPEPQDTLVSINIPLVYVSGGTFMMGCTAEQGENCSPNAKPAHQVTVDGFYIGKYEVTQAQWEAVTGSNPSDSKGDNLPVENVSWNDIVGTSGDYMTIRNIQYYADGFIYKLNKGTGKQYRLPTEAEWEYAARGGAGSRGYKYSGSNVPGNVAWYYGNSGNKTHPVGTKSANELGIYDMSGNVFEWCSDRYGEYSSNSQTNPTGPTTGSRRVDRGGGWNYGDEMCRVSYRYGDKPDYRYYNQGFRLACDSK